MGTTLDKVDDRLSRIQGALRLRPLPGAEEEDRLATPWESPGADPLRLRRGRGETWDPSS